MSIFGTAPVASPVSRREPVVQRQQPDRRPAVSVAEQRLRAVIESAPVSIIALKPEGDVLAANKMALDMVGAKHLTEVLGRNINAWVAPADRDAFGEFVSRTCRGEASTFEYRLVGPGDVEKAVETRAVPLLREGFPTTFLGVTWEVADRAARRSSENTADDERLRTQHDALKASLDSTTAAHEKLVREHEQALQLVQAANAEIQALRADADNREKALTGQWSDERMAIEARLQTLQEREVELAAGRDALERTLEELHAREAALLEERNTLAARVQDLQQQEATWVAQRNELEANLRAVEANSVELSAQFQAGQSAWREEQARLVGAHTESVAEQRAELEKMTKLVEAMREEHASMLEGARAERDQLAQSVQQLERRYEELVREREDLVYQRNAEREALEASLLKEQARSERLVREQENRWQQLEAILTTLRTATEEAARLGDPQVDDSANAPWTETLTAPKPEDPVSPDTTETGDECQWTF